MTLGTPYVNSIRTVFSVGFFSRSLSRVRKVTPGGVLSLLNKSPVLRISNDW